jgi:hypothetical protein
MTAPELAETCGCRFAGTAPQTHDRWIETFEKPTVRLLTALIGELELSRLGYDEEISECIDWQYLIVFVSQHNWTDPIHVYDLAEWLELATDNGRHGESTLADRRELRRPPKT